MYKSDNNNKISVLAHKIIELSANTLMVDLRFLDAALSELFVQEQETFPLAVDGKYIYYEPIHILKLYKSAPELPIRSYLHAILHCVYRHMFINNTLLEKTCWNLACDIAVEATINELGLERLYVSKQDAQEKEIQSLRSKVKRITAEVLYRYFLDGNVKPSKMQSLQNIFSVDDHELWYMPSNTSDQASSPDSDNDSDSDKQQNGNEKNDDHGKEGEKSGNSEKPYDSDENSSDTDQQFPSGSRMEELIQRWKDISERIQMDLESFSKYQGDKSGTITQNLREVNREKYDYTSFLKKFAVRGEVMKINDDEFDYIYYTYGLALYGNVPLIEPLEYMEVKRIREFVVAIDTSGSVSGELVQTFLQKTYNIIKSTESFFSKINIHIIQCDADIQQDVKITSQEEFDDYIKKMKLHGFGGTDFRPVFRYVDDLIKHHEFTNLKGLIYFTDGWGDFPSKMPDYDTAFVFIDEDDNNYDVPSWAIKLILRKDEI